VPTQRRNILAALTADVATIATANGFDTDAGLVVYVGEVPQLGDDDPDQAIAIIFGLEEPHWELPGKSVQIRLPIAICAVAKARTNAYLVIESLIGDIKRAIEKEDRTLGGLLTHPLERGPVAWLPRESGSTTVGAAVNYVIRIKEGWGAP
jgi:hypothetical protein